MKLKKRKKVSRMKGSRTHGFSAKLHKGKGSHGGKGMSGSGKRGDQKKTFVLKYLYPYFGKQGFTSRKTKKRKNNVINVQDLEKKFNEGKEIDLSDYKILGKGEIKKKLTIKADACSEEAKKKIEKAGGKVILPEKKQKRVEGKEKVKKEIEEEKE